VGAGPPTAPLATLMQLVQHSRNEVNHLPMDLRGSGPHCKPNASKHGMLCTKCLNQLCPSIKMCCSDVPALC